MRTFICLGAGNRGSVYSSFATAQPARAKVVAVAEPRRFFRDRLAALHNIPASEVRTDWRELADRPRFADAVIIATPDAMHAEQAIAFASLGYDILLEKPMATTLEDCSRIVDAARVSDILLAVCHVMRYTSYTLRMNELLQAGLIGDVVSVEHLEPVGYWHQAHSYVRGNWRSERASAPMLLAKSCHDIDWLRLIVGSECESVSSFGSLFHFRKSQKPEAAEGATNCLECSFEPQCPYSARKIYVDRLEAGHTGWPIDVVAPDVTMLALNDALSTGPYGRCVYECDNDVVDHQIVGLEFANGATASFTMTAFSPLGERKSRIFGTLGMLEGDGHQIVHTEFLRDVVTTIDVPAEPTGALAGHGGGDYGLMDAFVSAVDTRDASYILSGPDESLASHALVFAAEEARKSRQVVAVNNVRRHPAV